MHGLIPSWLVRTLLFSSFVIGGGMPGKAQDLSWHAPSPGPALCCASETDAFRLSTPDLIQRRFQIYRDTGFDMLRVEGLGSSIQAEDGRVVGPADLPYLLLARESGFRLKVNINVLGQPDWYVRAHPQSQLINEDGQAARGEISFWDPDTRRRVATMTRVVFAYMAEHALFDQVDYLAPDFGPASEPIYPAAWTQGESAKKDGEAFWFYAPNARADFARAMADHYTTLAAANTRWGTSFPAWSEVVIPKPGTRPGAMWEDVLTWYRDSKRDFILWQIHNFQAQLARYPQARGIRLLLYVPGTHFTEADWRQAVATGGGSTSIRLMCDSDFLLDTAGQEGCVLQYTGCENVEEVAYLLGRLHEKGRSIPMIGENAQEAARQPEQIGRAVVETELAGLDYTHMDVAFGPDLITGNDLLPRLKETLLKIKAAKR